MSFTSPVMSECSSHVFKHVHLSILYPLPLFHGVDPEWRPVILWTTSKLIIKLDLGKTVSSNWENTSFLGVLVYTGILVNRRSGTGDFDEIFGFWNVWRAQELSSFVPTITSTIVVIIWVEPSIESCITVKTVPLLARSGGLGHKLVEIIKKNLHICKLIFILNND